MSREEMVQNILYEISGSEKIALGATLQGDLGLDSLSMVTLLVEIEDAFSIELDAADMNPFQLTTVQSVIELVARYGGGCDEENC